jgi:hypothetical protein
VIPFAILGLLAVAGLVGQIVDWVRGPDTYEAASVIYVKPETLGSVESIANTKLFRVKLAGARDPTYPFSN